MVTHLATLQVVVCVCLNIRISFGRLIQGPENTMADEGERVTMACETDLTYQVYWNFKDKMIFYGNCDILQNYTDRFKVNCDVSGRYHLEIPTASKWHHGIYTCIDNEGKGENRSAWLTVTDHKVTTTSGNSATIVVSFASSVVLALLVGVAI